MLKVITFLVLSSSSSFANQCLPSNNASAIYQNVVASLQSSGVPLNETEAYNFLIRFEENQATSEEARRPLPGETALQYRTRLIEMQRNKSATVVALATASLRSYGAAHSNLHFEIHPGPALSPAILVKTDARGLRQILAASDRCLIYKIASVLVEGPRRP